MDSLEESIYQWYVAESLESGEGRVERIHGEERGLPNLDRCGERLVQILLAYAITLSNLTSRLCLFKKSCMLDMALKSLAG